MNGIFTWAAEKISAVKGAAVSWVSRAYTVVADATVSVFNTATYLLTYPSFLTLMKSISSQAVQALLGFSRAAWKAGNTIYHSSKTRMLLKAYLGANLTLLFFIQAQKALDNTSDPEERAYFEYLVQKMLSFYILRLKFHNFIDLTAIMASLLHDITAALAHHEHDDFQPCRCAVISRIKSNLDYPIDYLGRHGMVSFLSYLTGIYALPFRALEEGQNLLSYKLDAAGICPRHQYEILSSNNTYCMLIGALFLATTEGVSRLLSEKNDDVYGPVYNLFFPLLMITSLSLTKVLPNKKGGIDIFELGRILLKAAIKYALKMINICIHSGQNGNALETVNRYLSQFLSWLPMQVKTIFLDRNLHSLEGVVTRESVNDLIDRKGEDYRYIIKQLKRVNGFPGTRALPAVVNVLPVSGTVDLIAELVANPKLMPALRKADSLIVHGQKHKKAETTRRMLLAYRHENLTAPQKSPNDLTAGWSDMAKTIKEMEYIARLPTDAREVKLRIGGEPNAVSINAEQRALLQEQLSKLKFHDDYSHSKPTVHEATRMELIDDYQPASQANANPGKTDEALSDWLDLAPRAANDQPTSSMVEPRSWQQQSLFVTRRPNRDLFSREAIAAYERDCDPKASGVIKSRCANGRVG